MTKKTILLAVLLFLPSFLHAQRTEISLDDGWLFRFSHQMKKSMAVPVSLPHTWNAEDALSGKLDYKRGLGNYDRSLFVEDRWKGSRLFLRFEGANSIANVFINGKHIGEHRGGYSAFVFEITDKVRYGTDNKLLVRVNNAEQLDVLPLVGDFNMYGGLYRGVSLLVMGETCITPLDHASPGIYLTQKEVSGKQALVDVLVKLSNAGLAKEIEVQTEVMDGSRTVRSASARVRLAASSETQVTLPLDIRRPHLWNGTDDPFLYQVKVSLIENGEVIDSSVQPLGLRYYHVDPDKGFFLNGRHLCLKGVTRHQDRPGIGNALQPEHYQEDADIMRELGANAVRLAHYQQAEQMYDLMDQYGIITWAEIPFVGPGGYEDKGYVALPSFHENARQQLRELIRQNYNHPSILFWGLFNELKESGDNPVALVRELNDLAHQEDPSRLTTAASNQSPSGLNHITDLIAWNRYDGWYGGRPATLATYLDKMHAAHPELCIAISEYGAGASIDHQSDTLRHPKPAGWWHPENWQTWYHMENWKILHSRPYVWGSFIWNLFDFGAAHRREGDRPGINDKGLVTFDRKVKKDAFYFYKANWNPEPMVHVAGQRNDRTGLAARDIMAFTNCKAAELFVNGVSQGVQSPDEYMTVIWKGTALDKGVNEIRVVAKGPRECVSAFTLLRE